MKYYATLDIKHSMVTVVDEYACETFCDIITEHTQRLTAAEVLLADAGFTRVGEWEQFPSSWLIECERTTVDHSKMRDEALAKAVQMLEEAEKSVGDAHLSKHLTLAQLHIALAHELGVPGV
jgi:hypothetical protein